MTSGTKEPSFINDKNILEISNFPNTIVIIGKAGADSGKGIETRNFVK